MSKSSVAVVDSSANVIEFRQYARNSVNSSFGPNSRRGLIVGVYDPKRKIAAVGWSLCSRNDRFDADTGYTIARARAYKNLMRIAAGETYLLETTVNVPFTLNREVRDENGKLQKGAFDVALDRLNRIHAANVFPSRKKKTKTASVKKTTTRRRNRKSA